tara:strand:+ start:22146 stop:22424 length:279 start_codon:yes stop_codon:yes gene_type:complete
MKTTMRTLIISVFLLLMIGCSNLNHSYVEADIKTYKAATPNLLTLYSSVVDEFERELKFNTIKTWTIRIEEALKHEDLADLRAKFVKTEIPE